MNKNLLLSVIVGHGETQKILAEALGISRVTLSRKLSEQHNASFSLPEIAYIRKRYALSDACVMSIFFN